MGAPETICDQCGAPVTENVHGEVWHVATPAPERLVLAAEVMAEALKWAEDELASYAPDPNCRSKITDDVLIRVRTALTAWKEAQ